jgi:hypothetical protein
MSSRSRSSPLSTAVPIRGASIYHPMPVSVCVPSSPFSLFLKIVVGLGHVRLSIIDLATGQQPMSDEDRLIHCVVTGELYDHERIRTELESKGHTFKTKSDSELVVQLSVPHILCQPSLISFKVQTRRNQPSLSLAWRICFCAVRCQTSIPVRGPR